MLAKIPKAEESQTKTKAITPDDAPIAPSEHALLIRAMDQSSQKQRGFIYDLLTDFADAPVPPEEAALHAGAKALGISLITTDIKKYAEDFTALTLITIDREDWLYDFIHSALAIGAQSKKENGMRRATPEDIMGLLKSHMLDFDRDIRHARSTLQKYPEAFGAMAAPPAR